MFELPSGYREMVNHAMERNDLILSDLLTSEDPGTHTPFQDLPKQAKISGSAGASSTLILGPAARMAIDNGELSLTVRFLSKNHHPIENCLLYIGAAKGRISIVFRSSGAVVLGALGLVRIDARVGNHGLLVVGDKTTINGARFVAVNSNILVGRDGLWSDEILAQGFDQHGVLDPQTMTLMNRNRRDIVVGDHVWIGRRATLMPHIKIEEGAIIGTGALVTKSVPAFSAAAGNPAKVIRQPVTWSRSCNEVDDDTRDFLDSSWS